MREEAGKGQGWKLVSSYEMREEGIRGRIKGNDNRRKDKDGKYGGKDTEGARERAT
jgi:hypothetical protein